MADNSVLNIMKTIIVFCLILSVIERHYCIAPEEDDVVSYLRSYAQRNRRDTIRPNPPRPPLLEPAKPQNGNVGITKDIPKGSVVTIPARVSRDISPVPIPLQESPRNVGDTQGTRDIPKGSVAIPIPARVPDDKIPRTRRQTTDDTAPQTRPQLPGSAGLPQIQPPVRTAREAQRTPHAGAFSRDVPKQNVQPGRLTKDIPKTRPAIQRYRRQTADDVSPQTRPQLPGSAGQPQVQPPRTTREAQRTPHAGALSRDIPKYNVQPGRLTKDIPKTRPAIQRYRRSTADTSSQTRPQLPGSAGQPQIQPTVYISEKNRRDTDDAPNPGALSRDVPRELVAAPAEPDKDPLKLNVNGSPISVQARN